METAHKENFSYSKLDTFGQCRFKYKLQYVDGNYLYSDSIATEFGTLIHETEEAIAIAIRDSQPIDYVGLKNKILIKMCGLQSKYPNDYSLPDKSSRTYSEKAYEYLEFGIYRLENFMKQHPAYQIVGIEQEFMVPYNDNYILKGYIDRVFYDTENDKYIIQDIKTYPEPIESSKLKAPLQFVVYTFATELLYKAGPDKVICQYDLPLCNITQDVAPDYFNAGAKQLETRFKEIESGNFKPTRTALCHWCQFNPLVHPELLEQTNKQTGKPMFCPYCCTWEKKGDSIKESLMQFNGIEFYEIDTKQCKDLLLKK